MIKTRTLPRAMSSLAQSDCDGIQPENLTDIEKTKARSEFIGVIWITQLTSRSFYS